MLLRNKILISIVGGFCLFVLLMGCLPNAKIAFVDNSYQEVNNQEDIYIIQAYAALDMGDYKTARENLQKAYELTKNKEYLREIIGLLVLEKDFLKAKNAAKDYLKVSPKDAQVRQALVEILGSLGDSEGAVQEVQILLKNNASVHKLEIAYSVYFLQKDYSRALEYLQKAYEINKDEKILDKIVSIHLLFFKDRNKAIMVYETHIKKYGISKNVGEKLALIYLEDKRFLEAARNYEKLYKATQEQKYARFALEIYIKGQYLTKAERFLEQNPSIQSRDEMLLEIYRLNKETTKSIQLLQKLYKKSGNVDYLALEAMILYENSTNKNQTFLKKIVGKFEEVLKKSDNSLYWNYLGYLLIDHNLDVKKGIQCVQKALEKEPQNPYYLDSLAWGYYKQKDCKNAKEIINKISKEEREKEKEIFEHFRVIEKCKF